MKNSNSSLHGFGSAFALFCIHIYQILLSPDHGIFAAAFGYQKCKFFPTCSAYMYDAIRQYGLLRGGMVSLKRILCCHPWSHGGYDPLIIKI